MPFNKPSGLFPVHAGTFGQESNNTVMLTILSILIIGYLIRKNGIESLYHIEHPVLRKVVLLMLKYTPERFLPRAV